MHPRVLINFEHVNMMDSSGLGALMEARAIADTQTMVVLVCHPCWEKHQEPGCSESDREPL